MWFGYTRAMKRLVLIIIIACLAPLTALSHPGKTDRYGGHQCLKGCEDWGLFFKEYHLHDKDGKPVRVSRKKQAPPADGHRDEATGTAPTETEPAAERKTEAVTRYVTVVREESVVAPDPLLFVVLVLLLLLLLLLLILRTGRSRRPQG